MKQYLHWSIRSEIPYVLNLDDGFNPITKSSPLEFKKFTFHGGEPHFQILSAPYSGELIITQRYNTIGDLFDIILANDAVRRLGYKNIKLVLPYFPAARQDRVCNGGEPLTLRVFTDMINGCGFNEVIILCPHSEVTPALLNNVTILDELDYVCDIIVEDEEHIEFNIVCPDAGAGKRVNKIVQHLATNLPNRKFNLIRCEKVRDVTNGKLTGFFVQADDLKGYPTIIVDDINCMAGTFIGLGEELKKKNCGTLSLFTTHSDCEEGIKKASGFFKHVYTTNSKRNWDTVCNLDNLTCFKISL